MRTVLGILAFIAAVSTVLFLVLFILGIARAGPMQTYEQVLAVSARQDVLFTLAYANVTFLTIIASMFFAALYVYCRSGSPLWSFLGVIFVPVYTVFNLVAYFSQITVVPRLLELAGAPENQAVAEFLLRQLIQQWPESAVSVYNNLAYAILGIPSIIFGVILYQKQPELRTGGLLLALNGVACIAGVLGIVLGSSLFAWGSIVGAVFFLLALIMFAWAFLRGS
ncbi:MAG: hypothetical protein ACWGO1_02705 [Anaerolineales bacterium]